MIVDVCKIITIEDVACEGLECLQRCKVCFEVYHRGQINNRGMRSLIAANLFGASGQGSRISHVIVTELVIAANGPAIWGGCVTRRKHRAGS